MKSTFIALTLAVALAACNSGTKNNSEKSTDENAVAISSKASTNPDDLLGKEWKLQELNGAKVTLDTAFKNYPYLKFDGKGKAMGNLGCNGFGANTRFSGTDSLSITDIIGTQMACPNLKVEQDFSEALRNTRTFQLDGHTLYLNNEKHTVVAKLETY